MPIIYHESSKNFHLYNGQISYIMTILRNGQLGQLYFGKAIRDKESFGHLLELRPRAMAVCTYEFDRVYSMEHIKQEYPSYGSGDMRHPAFEILQENGSRITNFVYKSHRIFPGKPALKGLPATYVENADEAVTLEITLEDALINTELVLTYTIYEQLPVIARNARFVSHHRETLVLGRAMSLNLDLPDKDYEMIELTGAWSRERSVKSRRLEHGIQSIYSMRGCSSSNFNPFLALKRPQTTEHSGPVYGFSLVYSGNFLAQVEVDTYDVSRITMGIHPENFSWPLAAGDTFQTPEAVMVYSEEGLNGMSQTFHTLYGRRLARGSWRDRPRPILINNWEATYFNFNEEKILTIAKKAKELGIELFVLDDGWFGQRDNDLSSLGDWYPNLEKLPEGITGLARKIEAMGMKFGLWFEPEMTNFDSDLYRAHPDWILSTPGRSVSHGRCQYVLDFSRDAVVDHIYGQMHKILSEAPVSYVKWDMNRCMSEVYSHGLDASLQGTVMHRYILGVYRLYERLTGDFPEILFESCASGGARFDPGMLYYAPQCWTSDDTDAVERQKIQYGTSYVYPISSMGAHVSAVPNHQVMRSTPLNTRANVAYFGTFGYELDITKLPEDQLREMSKQIDFMKKNRSLLQFGTFYRLLSPFEGNVTAWMVVSTDKTRALVGFYRMLQPINIGYQRLLLKGLDKNMDYRVTLAGQPDADLSNKKSAGPGSQVGLTVGGDELMFTGLVTSDAASGENSEGYRGDNGDFQSRIYVLEAVNP